MSARGRTPAADVARAADVLVRDYMAVRAGESVLITADTATDPGVTEAIMVAVAQADARPSVLTIPRLPNQGALAVPYIPPVVAGAVAGCAVWVDLTFPYLAGSSAADNAIHNGNVRDLLGGDMRRAQVACFFGAVTLGRYYEVHRAFDEVTAAAIDRPIRITDTRLGRHVHAREAALRE